MSYTIGKGQMSKRRYLKNIFRAGKNIGSEIRNEGLGSQSPLRLAQQALGNKQMMEIVQNYQKRQKAAEDEILGLGGLANDLLRQSDLLAQGGEDMPDIPQNGSQRDFHNLRKHFRQAVDERNDNYEDYKQQSRGTRFKWAVKNPLAWAFGRTEGNKKKTEQRTERRKMLESLDPDTLEPVLALPEEGHASESVKESPQGSVMERAKALEKVLPKDSIGGAPVPKGYLTTASRRARELERENQALGERNEGEQRARTGKRVSNGSLGALIGGVAASGPSTIPYKLATWNDKDGMKETLDNAADTLEWDGLDKWNEKASEALGNVNGNILNGVSGGMNMMGGISSGVSGILEMRNGIVDTKRLWQGGDKQAAIARGFDIVGGGVDTLKGANTFARGIGQAIGAGSSVMAPTAAIAGGLNAVGGLAKTVSGSIEVNRAKKVKESTENIRNFYESRLKRLEEREKDPNTDAKAREEIAAYRRQLEAQIGLMRMGHNTARVDHTRAGFKVADGVLNTVGGVVTAAGGGAAGTAIGLAGTVTGLVGKGYTSHKDSKLKRGEVDITLDMDARIGDLLRRARERDKYLPADKRLNLTEREAKQMILRKAGYVSRSHAYINMARDRKEQLEKLPQTDRDAMVRALGLDPKKATEQMIYQRLGMDEKQAANIDRAMLKQKKKRMLPSWRR